MQHGNVGNGQEGEVLGWVARFLCKGTGVSLSLRFWSSVFGLGLAGALAVCGPVWGESLEAVEPPSGATFTQGGYISGDGSTVAGATENASGYQEAFRWTPGGGIVRLGYLPGGMTSYSYAYGINADGSVVVGGSSSAVGTEAFRWTAGTGMLGLGGLAGGDGSSEAYGVSGDGSVVVGTSDSANGQEAFRWTAGGGMVGLGDLSGGVFSSLADAANADGSVIVGFSQSANGQEAFRWTAGGGMVGLGGLITGPGFESYANGVSSDGSVVIGYSMGSNGYEAFRWTAGTGMVGLGDLPGGGFGSYAYGVSGNGQVVVGESDNGGSSNDAFRWTAADGMVSIRDTLAAAGLDVSGWQLKYANSTNNDGSVIAGVADHNGQNVVFLANMAGGGLTTPGAVVESLAKVGSAGAQNSKLMVDHLGASMNMAQSAARMGPVARAVASSIASNSSNPADIEPAAGPASSGMSLYMTGRTSVNDGEDLSGVAGVTAKITDEIAVGAGGLRGRSLVRFDGGGKSQLDSTGGVVVASYEAKDSGLRAYASGYAAALSQDTVRAYMNGGGTDASRGTTEGSAFGADLKLGWQEHLASLDTRVMPYVEGRYVHTALDGYTEVGGAFPATYGKRKDDYTAALFGIEVEKDFWDTFTVTARVGAGRRLGGGTGTYTADVGGVIGQDVLWTAWDKNWTEAALGLGWQYSPTVRLMLEGSLRDGDVYGTDVAVQAGTNILF